ncbi:uncharacterized protein LOC124885295 [Capsicum annuum]|uniref:uncharacterized protein LOC124885295 n=1 Tax=Capsicum annuum TaxID=4072 RepID=UPI001FB04EE5|nr:uncharacterized protein LOC124885295 [Capsicum annuum]
MTLKISTIPRLDMIGLAKPRKPEIENVLAGRGNFKKLSRFDLYTDNTAGHKFFSVILFPYQAYLHFLNCSFPFSAAVSLKRRVDIDVDISLFVHGLLGVKNITCLLHVHIMRKSLEIIAGQV